MPTGPRASYPACSIGLSRATYLPRNPVAGMKKRAKEQSKERTLTDAEIAALMAALENPQSVSVDVADALRVILSDRPASR